MPISPEDDYLSYLDKRSFADYLDHPLDARSHKDPTNEFDSLFGYGKVH